MPTSQVYRWLGTGLVVGGVLLAAGVARAQQFPDPTDKAKLYEAAKKEGAITWYTSFSPEGVKIISDLFNKDYPGIAISSQRLIGVQQYQKFVLETESKQSIVDMLQIADRPSMQDLIQRKFVADWKVPTIDRFEDANKLGTSSYAPYMVVNGVAYNKDKVTPEEVEIIRKDWSGLLDPRFKGRLAITDQPGAPSYQPLYMFMDPKMQSRYGADFVNKLAATKPAVYTSTTAELDRVTAGEQHIAFWGLAWSSSFVAWSSGAPIRWVYPASTPMGPTVWWAVSSVAPHPNAARLFLNWLMDEPGQRAYQATGWSAAMKGLPDNNPAAKEAWYKPVQEPYLITDFNRWDREQERDMKRFLDAVKANR